MKHSGGVQKKKGLHSRNGGGSNCEVLFRAVTPFTDTHGTLNSSPESKQPPAIVCLLAVMTSRCFLHFAVMSRRQKTHEVLITASQHGCICAVERRE